MHEYDEMRTEGTENIRVRLTQLIKAIEEVPEPEVDYVLSCA